MEILLVRHGVTAWNENNYCQGRRDVPLSQRGRAQAESLAAPVTAFAPDAVLTSPLVRAQQTARAAGYANGRVLEQLTELDRGHWEGHDMAEVKRRWGKFYRAWYAEPEGLVLPGGEGFDALWVRAGEALALAADAGERVAVFAHKAINRALLAHALGQRGAAVWEIAQPPACVSQIRREGDGWKAVRIGEETHLPQDLRAPPTPAGERGA